MITGWEWIAVLVAALLLLAMGPRALLKFRYSWARAKLYEKYAKQRPLTEKEKKRIQEWEEELAED